MKKFSVLLIMAGIVLGSEFVPREKIETLAYKFVEQRYGSEYRLSNVITYFGIDESPNAHGYVFQDGKDSITIIMGARYTTSPVGEIYHSAPYCEKFLNRALDNLRKQISGEPVFQHYYYFGAGEEYAGFDVDGKKMLVNVRNGQIRLNEELEKCKSDPNLESLTRQKWERYLEIDDFRILQSGYVDSVPFIDWVYGCSPTAASMMFWYWDYRGYGKLVDHFFTHWDNPENEWNDCANTNRELAIAMNTDTLTGGTTIGNIRPGMLTVANTYNSYSFTSATSPQGGNWNQYVFSWIKTEIDGQRPCHWNVLYYWYPPMSDYINHSITGVGYEITSSDTFVIVHTTWDNNEPLWPLWTYYNGVYSYDYVVTLVPGGSNPNNVFLDYPRGGDTYNIPVMFKNIKYAIRWHTEGTEIDHMKLWWSKGNNLDSYDSLRWTLIANNVPNTGKYVWTCTDVVGCSLRVNISALNSGNTRLAADGSFGRSRVVELNHSTNVNLIGHYDTPGWANDVVVLGNYAYIVDGPAGLIVLDVSDSTLPDYVNQISLPGNSITITGSSQYLYIGDREDTLRILSLSNPTNPVQIGKLSLADDVLGLFVSGNTLYVCARSQGLVIVNVQNPASPVILGTFNTAGFAYDVVVSNNFAYVADATKGVRIIDVSTPSNPVETGYYDTNGIAYSVAKAGNYVYAADGTAGIKVFDVSNSDTLVLLGSLDTPGTASGVQYFNNHIFVADGTAGGIRVINVASPSAPAEVGYMLSVSTATSFDDRNNLIYLADGNSGLLIIKQDVVGVEENYKESISGFLKVLPQPANLNSSVHIQFSIDKEITGAIEVFDITGRKTATIYQGRLSKGNNDFLWLPDGCASGVYFVRVHTGEHNFIIKVLLVK
ncbi:MAG: T9SS type A sorting domain-containing protein [bacterium]